MWFCLAVALLLCATSLLWERARLVYEYHKCVSSAERRAILEAVPEILDWSEDSSLECSEVSLGFARFCYAFGELQETAMPGYAASLLSSSARVIVGMPLSSSYAAWKHRTRLRTARDRALGFSRFEVSLLLWDRATATGDRVIADQEWSKIERDPTLYAYWRQYGDQPYLWTKQMLSLVPRSIVRVAVMPLQDLETRVMFLQRKALVLQMPILFESPLVDGMIDLLPNETPAQVRCVFWNSLSSFEQYVTITYEGQQAPLDELRAMVTSFEYEIAGEPTAARLHAALATALVGEPSFTPDVIAIERYILRNPDPCIVSQMAPRLRDINEETYGRIVDDSMREHTYYHITVAHLAAASKHIRIAQAIIQNGADINSRGDRDERPLHIAAQYGSPEMVKLLLAHGADPNLVDRYGFSPLAMASTPEKIALLKTHSATGGNCPPQEQWSVDVTKARLIANGLVNAEINPDDLGRLWAGRYNISVKVNAMECYYAVIYARKLHGYDSTYVEFWVKVSGKNGEANLHEVRKDQL